MTNIKLLEEIYYRKELEYKECFNAYTSAKISDKEEALNKLRVAQKELIDAANKINQISVRRAS